MSLWTIDFTANTLKRISKEVCRLVGDPRQVIQVLPLVDRQAVTSLYLLFPGEQMEDIMYSLDGDKLLELITELEKYQYKGEALKEVLVPIRRKVESYDYVSAVESMIRWKNGLPK